MFQGLLWLRRLRPKETRNHILQFACRLALRFVPSTQIRTIYGVFHSLG